ncbi:WcbI family polysaccharide biosynthesis putative acetyltransferase [Alteromonas sp. Mac1]|uniref:WcbI family polysaccharide biosynthesis putative acetyltransferase n=1 Tax=Alteromonas sp. Mac1 TaxID=1777491 RepID=UPI0007705A0A|nr:WcbI family polysaccharide biosynthesis putative acetyltransferase [Alteromonas sp. Mac1]AMJ88208.1 hypothetical protein AV939_17510 [Alteromonas sp. Mac1]AMJ92065.1 hypothetical protein AV940_17210 [Alteromonas sp. Mac2]
MLNKFQIDSVRDAANLIKDINPSLAFELISIAFEGRCKGPAINALLEEIKAKENIVTVSLIGNCQVTPLAQLLKEKCKKIKVLKIVPVHLYDGKDKNLYEILQKSDFIITQLIGDNFGDVSTSQLRQKFETKILTIPKLFYTGFHQDWIYLPRIRGVRLQSPIGDYHNKTVIDGYLLGKPPSEVVNDMCSYEYNNKIYGEVARLSLEELKQRDLGVDVGIAKELEFELDKSSELFHTFNHPKMSILNIVANKLVKKIGLKNEKIYSSGECLNSIILPTNPIVTERSKTDLIYNGERIDFRDFVTKSFKIYHENPEFMKSFQLQSKALTS